MSQLLQASRRQLDLFKWQYLQLQAQVTYPDGKNLGSESFQQAIYDEVFADDAVEYHPPERYQRRILKELMARVEASITDWEEEGICEDLMSRYAVLLASPLPSEAASAQQKHYVTYCFPSLCIPSDTETTRLQPVTITLLEARSLLAAGGTTGLRTWEACLHLASFLSSPTCPLSFTNKSVLELGAGTGLISILCAKHLGASQVIASDGSDAVVADLPNNFLLNDLQEDSHISAKELWWGHSLTGGEEPKWNSGRKVDIVLGADVTYDSLVIPALVATIDDLVELNPNVEIVISATIRNEDTFDTFLKTCAQKAFSVDEYEWVVPTAEAQCGPFYSDNVAIRICRIKKRVDA